MKKEKPISAHPQRQLLHHGERKFSNAAGAAGRGWRHYWRWVTSGKKKRWPRRLADARAPQLPAQLPSGAVAATFIGQSTFLLQVGGLNLLTDPVYSERVGPFNFGGPRRVRAPGVPFEQLPRIHGVLLSHNHYDHTDLATLRRLRRAFDPWIVTGLGNERFLRKEGFRKIAELDWWQNHKVESQFEITFTPAQHFSNRHFFDRDQTLWGGFIVSASGQRIYFVGDSGYGDHFKEIGGRTSPIDLSLIPIGAYEPRWFMQLAHVNPDEAVQIHLDVQSRQSIGMHFGTFQLTDEGIDEPIHDLRAALQARGVAEESFLVPEFGRTIIVQPQDSGRIAAHGRKP